ncbi:xanthine dehydrogenase family protein molybdopterin-binding subunit [Achromobacter aloeverae]|uniref:Oxidoreductase n=1 Tax=Achromobacter aloeverae TaxID=1750518 RepID=A0A4Q1HI69_9BURK|nr:molybdopterin cofactor-binding domain-containing protein [Achromobacter aloeverae]RXN87922.1 oxidoreductase [Achromobacter aloeverae]
MTAPAPSALPPSLRANPRLSTWLDFSVPGRARVRSGKVEIGQGIHTALAQIAAEELGVSFARIVMVAPRTALSPDEAVTSGSLSIQHSGAALRHVCAQARALYLDHVAAAHGLPADAVRVDDGVFLHGAERLGSYWEVDAGLLDQPAVPDISPRPRADYREVGRSRPRDDIAEKVYGRYRYIHDIELPGLLHGRMLRPPSPAARLLALDATDVAAWPGVVAVARDGTLAGVIATREDLAERALARLAAGATWEERATLPDAGALPAWLKTLPRDTLRWQGGTAQAPRRETPADGRRTFRAAYSRPFLKHAAIGPSCALARDDGARLEVWTHSQAIYNLRRDLALALRRPEDAIVIEHVQGAGCYGHNGADDVAYDATWLAGYCPGRPVRVQWSRADELNWSPLGPAMAIELEADVDEDGRVLAWRHEAWSPGHGLRPGRAPSPTLLGTWHLAAPFPRLDAVDAPRAVGGGMDRNAEPGYAFPRVDVTCHRVRDVPIRASALRALGAHANVFAIESFMDELAHAANISALAYRLAHITDPRMAAVLRAAWAASERDGGYPGSDSAGEGGVADGGIGSGNAGSDSARSDRAASDRACSDRAGSDNADSAHGRGCGVARYKGTGAYCAVVAHVDVDDQVRLRALHIAVDVGLAINPDGVRQQIEGGALQAASWTLQEATRFDAIRLLDGDWESYPIMRFSQVPRVSVDILPRPDDAPLGAGEAALGPTAAAIANAVADALGVRVRHMPLTPERVIQAMAHEETG